MFKHQSGEARLGLELLKSAKLLADPGAKIVPAMAIHATLRYKVQHYKNLRN